MYLEEVYKTFFNNYVQEMRCVRYFHFVISFSKCILVFPASSLFNGGGDDPGLVPTLIAGLPQSSTLEPLVVVVLVSSLDLLLFICWRRFLNYDL